MKYICVRWNHQNPDEPEFLYSELDDERRETRKVEVYADGRWDYADDRESTGTTGLGEGIVPELSAIATDPGFEPREITPDEFERIGSQRGKRPAGR